MDNKMIKFENSDIAVEMIDGQWMFELYAVGMALGQVKVAKGISYPRKDRIDENAKNADIKPVVHNGQPFITESQVYDLMLETRTDKCRAFRKWLTNEVLPELNHTGTYSIKKEETKPYDYFDKTWNGEPVLTAKDVQHITGICGTTALTWLKNHGVALCDYIHLSGNELIKFKAENPKVKKSVPSLGIITKNGFKALCKAYGIKVDEPKCFEESEQPKLSVPKSKEEKLYAEIEKAKAKATTINTLLEKLDSMAKHKDDGAMEKCIYDFYAPALCRVLGAFQVHIEV